MPKNNLLKIGVAVAAAAVGAVLAITSVFAHAVPTTSGHSIVGSIVKAEVAASFPLVSFDTAPNTATDEQASDAEEAGEIAAQQAELAARQAAAAAEKAAAAADQQDEDTGDQQDGDVENQAGNADQGDQGDQGGD